MIYNHINRYLSNNYLSLHFDASSYSDNEFNISKYSNHSQDDSDFG